MKKTIIATLLVALATTVSANAEENPTLSEEEMRAKELNKDFLAPDAAKPIAFRKLSQLGYHYAYIEAWQRQAAAPEQAAPAGRGASAGDVVMTVAAIDGIANGVMTPHNDALVGVAIALDVASIFLGGGWNDKVMKALREEYEVFKAPALYLVDFAAAVPVEGMTPEQAQDTHELELRRLFDTARGVLEKSALDCEPAYYNSQTVWGNNIVRGSHAPGFYHERAYLCGHLREDLGVFRTASLRRNVFVRRIEDGRFVTHINYPGIADNDALLERLGITSADGKRNAAKVLLAALEPNIPASWFAVYSAENVNGEWKLFVSSKGKTVEFDPPPDPDKLARAKTK